MNNKIIVGNIEICDLPGLGICDLQVRIDTGAKTSSLHVDGIEKFTKNGKPWLKFDIHPDIHNVTKLIACEAPIHDVRKIKSSNGITEERYVIQTDLTMNDQQWPIEITLTNRAEMSYLMLLGRQGMGDKLLVDPSKTFLLNKNRET